MSETVAIGLVVLVIVFLLFALVMVFEALDMSKTGALAVLITLTIAAFALERIKPGILENVVETLFKAVFPNRSNLFIGQ